MSLFFPKALAFPGEKVPRPGDADDFWYQKQPYLNQSGACVTPDSAMRVAAVNACVRIIAESVASLPLLIYKWRKDGGKERAEKHPLYDVLRVRPNRWQTSFEWREMMQAHLLLRGNAYSRIVPGPRGVVDQLVPLHPDQVEPKISDVSGDVIYKVTPPKGQAYVLPAALVFHLRGLSTNGIVGVSPIEMASEAIGLSLSMEGFGARFFSQGSAPPGLLSTDNKLNKEQREAIKKSWTEANTGAASWHKPAVLEGGLKWTQLGISNQDSQFLETRKFQRSEIAMIFRIPPHMIGDLEKTTSWGTGIEEQAIGFVVYTLIPWLRRWEQAISYDLIIADDWYFAEFLVDALLRGNMAARKDFFSAGRQWGWFSVNDILKMENRNPIGPIGDTRLVPAGYTEVKPDGTRIANATQTPDKTTAYQKTMEDGKVAAEKAVRREVAAIRSAIASVGKEGIASWAEKYYKDRAPHLCRVIGMTQDAAAEYVLSSAGEIAGALANGGIEPLLMKWEKDRAIYLFNLAWASSLAPEGGRDAAQ
jgi:HK97 family phage portal protein